MILKTTLNNIKSGDFFNYYESLLWDKSHPENMSNLNVIETLAYIEYVEVRLKEAKDSLIYMVDHYETSDIEFRIEIHKHFDYIKKIEVIIP